MNKIKEIIKEGVKKVGFYVIAFFLYPTLWIIKKFKK